MITLLLIALLHDHFTFSCLFVFKTNISNINCVICYLIGYSGVKCETASATVPPTTPKAFSCSDCLAPGTEYCAFINNAMSCKCKQGKQYGQKMISVGLQTIKTLNGVSCLYFAFRLFWTQMWNFHKHHNYHTCCIEVQ